MWRDENTLAPERERKSLQSGWKMNWDPSVWTAVCTHFIEIWGSSEKVQGQFISQAFISETLRGLLVGDRPEPWEHIGQKHGIKLYCKTPHSIVKQAMSVYLPVSLTICLSICLSNYVWLQTSHEAKVLTCVLSWMVWVCASCVGSGLSSYAPSPLQFLHRLPLGRAGCWGKTGADPPPAQLLPGHQETWRPFWRTTSRHTVLLY